MTFELRPYQQKLIEDLIAIHSIAEPIEKLLAVSPTGSGKTVVMSALTKRMGLNTLVVSHRGEIVSQNRNALDTAFSDLGISCGHIQSQREQTQSSVQSASIQTLHRMAKADDPLPMPGKVELLLIDEAHLNRATMLDSVLSASWISEHCRTIGFTATPCTQSGRGLGDIYNRLVEGPTRAELVALGHAPPAIVLTSPQWLDTSGVPVQAGEFNLKQLSNRNKPERVAEIVLASISHARDQLRRIDASDQGIVFAPSVAASKAIAEALRLNGIQAVHLDGKTTASERQGAIEGFRKGAIEVITNFDCLSEGFDVPRCKWLVLARPTASVAKHLQMFGRALRGTEEVIVMDPAGNVQRHGLPEEFDGRWCLESAPEIQPRLTVVNSDGEVVSISDPQEIRQLQLIGFTELLASGELRKNLPEVCSWDRERLSEAEAEIVETCFAWIDARWLALNQGNPDGFRDGVVDEKDVRDTINHLYRLGEYGPAAQTMKRAAWSLYLQARLESLQVMTKVLRRSGDVNNLFRAAVRGVRCDTRWGLLCRADWELFCKSCRKKNGDPYAIAKVWSELNFLNSKRPQTQLRIPGPGPIDQTGKPMKPKRARAIQELMATSFENGWNGNQMSAHFLADALQEFRAALLAKTGVRA